MEIVQTLLTLISSDAAVALPAILFCGIIYLLWDRHNYQKLLIDAQQQITDSKDQHLEAIKDIIDKYHNGNLAIVQALNEIKIVLTSMQRSL